MPLTDAAIRAAKPGDKARKLFDGEGLYLELSPAGGRWWRLKYRWAGREKRLSLGTYPAVSLLDARRRRDEAKRTLAAGEDPSAVRRTQKMVATAASNTFEVVARRWHKDWARSRTVKHADQVLRRLELDVFPRIGLMPITSVRAPDVVALAKLVEARGALDLARRAIQITGQVYRYAIAHGLAEHNPARDFAPGDVLRPPREDNYARVQASRLPAFLRSINTYHGHPRTRLALHLMSLVFIRTGELIATPLAEIEDALKVGRWDIPAARMKMPTPHVVPLARQTTQVLQRLLDLSGGGQWLLPGAHDHERHLSNNALLFAIYGMGYKGEMTGHGFRGVASTALHEADFEHEHIELQLAHQRRDRVSAAYNWAQYLPQRAAMMQWWADELDRLRGAPITL
ncbi:tyrosine-type recombinase/integrase [Ottowia sp.]|uniref:tyrosine-type recombinase/integrase n=1 Tax=Ottowia sp. TaxID=1898956 RepID=UPI003A899559